MVRHVTEVESHLFQVNCSIICCFVFIVWPFLDSAGGANALMKSFLHDSDSVFCSSSQKFQALYALFGILFFATVSMTLMLFFPSVSHCFATSSWWSSQIPLPGAAVHSLSVRTVWHGDAESSSLQTGCFLGLAWERQTPSPTNWVRQIASCTYLPESGNIQLSCWSTQVISELLVFPCWQWDGQETFLCTGAADAVCFLATVIGMHVFHVFVSLLWVPSVHCLQIILQSWGLNSPLSLLEKS